MEASEDYKIKVLGSEEKSSQNEETREGKEDMTKIEENHDDRSE